MGEGRGMIWRRITWMYRDLSQSAYIFPFTTVRRGSQAGPAPLKACVSPFIRAIIHFSFFFGGSFPSALSDCGAGIISWPSAGIFVFCIFLLFSVVPAPSSARCSGPRFLLVCLRHPSNEFTLYFIDYRYVEVLYTEHSCTWNLCVWLNRVQE